MEINIEDIVNQQIVAEVFKKIPEEKRDAILEQSLTKVLRDVFNTWQVESAVKADAERFMAEYIKKPEVQERIKASVEKSFDNIIEGMTDAFETRIDDTISSKYISFKKRSNKGDEQQ